ncbi:MAG: hypothetical protein LZF61_02330 [Nitrosomonas sp.]|nr:MAG: hypothetical protein LZF61_02330 [Nitrosomonas sp.]
MMAAEGYVYGQLSKVSHDKNITRVYLGEISLGHESMTFISFGNQPTNLVTNPWQFCFEKDRYEEIENFVGKNVVLAFTFPKNNNLLSCSSVYELQEIYPVNQDHVWEQKHFVGDIYTSDPETSYGVEFGRITNLIKNKSVNRIYYMTLQVGNGGSKFRHFMIDDHDLYEFAINALKSAVMVKVHYSDRISYGNSYGLGARSVVAEIEVVEQ